MGAVDVTTMREPASVRLRLMEVDIGQSIGLATELGLYAYDVYMSSWRAVAGCHCSPSTSSLARLPGRPVSRSWRYAMKTYTYSEARQRLATLLDLAGCGGAARQHSPAICFCRALAASDGR